MERLTYTVKDGDTLTAISRRLGVPVSSIFAMNRGKSQSLYDPATGQHVRRTFTNPHLIWPGFVLTVGEQPDPIIDPVGPLNPGESSGGGFGLLAAAGALFFLMS